MKRLKFLMVFVFLLVGTLTLFSFTNEKYHKAPLFTECLSYIGPRLTSPPYTGLKEASYWTTMYEIPGEVCDGGVDICAICFDNTQLTASQARQILWEYRINHGSYPPNGSPIIDNGRVLWVYTKTI